MLAPLGIFFIGYTLTYLCAWPQVHSVRSLLLGEQGACALLSSPGRRDTCWHPWESSFVGVRATPGKQACLQPIIDQALDGPCSNGTIPQSSHVCMCAGLQCCNCTLNACAHSVCAIAAPCLVSSDSAGLQVRLNMVLTVWCPFCWESRGFRTSERCR